MEKVEFLTSLSFSNLGLDRNIGSTENYVFENCSRLEKSYFNNDFICKHKFKFLGGSAF